MEKLPDAQDSQSLVIYSRVSDAIKDFENLPFGAGRYESFEEYALLHEQTAQDPRVCTVISKSAGPIYVTGSADLHSFKAWLAFAPQARAGVKSAWMQARIKCASTVLLYSSPLKAPVPYGISAYFVDSWQGYLPGEYQFDLFGYTKDMTDRERTSLARCTIVIPY